jgi:hypothetical protein
MTGTSQDLYGAKYFIKKAGADTSPDTYSIYGNHITATNTGSTAAGIKNTTGLLANAVGDASGTSTAYGIQASASGADTNYALTTWSGSIHHTLDAGEKVYINATSTPQTQTSGTLDIDVTTVTTGVTGANIYVDSNATTGIGVYGLETQVWSDAVLTATNNVMTGAYFQATKSGADTSTDASTAYGLISQAQVTGSTDVGTRLTYGGSFSATGDTAGTSTAYGVYAAASGADTNWSIYAVGNLYAPSIAVGASSELTISGGAVAATKTFHTVDTEGDGATDDLTAISGGTPGQFLVLMAANDARSVVVKDGGTLYIAGDHTMDGDKDTIVLMCITAGTWVEIARSNNN